MEKERYLEYVKQTSPKTSMVRSLFLSFVVGGLICCIGQFIADMIKLAVPNISKEMLSSATSIILIFLGSFFTGVGLYDKLGYYAGGGSIIPITGFANSIVSPAMEYNREGVVFGVCAKMFTIAGPIIVFGIVASVIVGLVGMFFV
ncbi:MAG: SpoVA/SpoVAEb family sporulation membrane protein [Clostridiales bacterium]|nr:SpoVA/SpoVAEb family sporulation membrane protein [Clostridiales bacterium]